MGRGRAPLSTGSRRARTGRCRMKRTPRVGLRENCRAAGVPLVVYFRTARWFRCELSGITRFGEAGRQAELAGNPPRLTAEATARIHDVARAAHRRTRHAAARDRAFISATYGAVGGL